jgi:ribosomal protein S18 acetylase RimI-like enzyme
LSASGITSAQPDPARLCQNARPVPYVIESAREDDLAKLRRIELAANALFGGHAVAGVVADDATGLDELAHAHAAGLLWVARAADGEPVGFALCHLVDGALHLEEIDVDPAYGRRGVGRALLHAVIAGAERAGRPAVTLTTFRDIPWNAPFYARAGFRTLAAGELGPGLAALVHEEAARGLDPSQRVVMRLDLAGAAARR